MIQISASTRCDRPSFLIHGDVYLKQIDYLRSHLPIGPTYHAVISWIHHPGYRDSTKEWSTGDSRKRPGDERSVALQSVDGSFQTCACSGGRPLCCLEAWDQVLELLYIQQSELGSRKAKSSWLSFWRPAKEKKCNGCRAWRDLINVNDPEKTHSCWQAQGKRLC